MIVAAAALSSMLQTCAPTVEPATMIAIMAVESGLTRKGPEFELHPWAIGDNTTRKSYAPVSFLQAVSLANRLILRGDNIDVGLGQVNSANFAGYHTSAAAMFMPCQNLAVASSILANAYAGSSAVFSDPRAALWHAISAYNTGSLYAGARYVKAVVAEASRGPLVPSIDLLTHSGDVVEPVVIPQRSALPIQSVLVSARRKTRIAPADFGAVSGDSRTLAVRADAGTPIIIGNGVK